MTMFTMLDESTDSRRKISCFNLVIFCFFSFEMKLDQCSSIVGSLDFCPLAGKVQGISSQKNASYNYHFNRCFVNENPAVRYSLENGIFRLKGAGHPEIWLSLRRTNKRGFQVGKPSAIGTRFFSQ